MKLTQAQKDLLKKMPLKIGTFRFTGHEGTKKACMKRGLIETIKDDEGSVSKVVLTKDGRTALKAVKD